MAKKKVSRLIILKKLLDHLKVDWYRYVFDTLVVVVGILVAFSLDSWYEASRGKTISKAYAIALVSDLQDDIDEVRDIISNMNESIIRIDSLSDYTRDKDIADLSNLDLLALIQVTNKPYSWNRTTIDDLKQSGMLRINGDNELSRMITEYEAFTKHMEDDYYYDFQIREEVTAKADEVINLNYPNYPELSKIFEISNYPILEHDFSQTPAYQEAKAYSLDLLTTDMSQVQTVVNGYLRLRFFLKVRAEGELPRLIKNAEAIVSYLESNYIQ